MSVFAKGLFLLVAVFLFTNAKILVAYHLGVRSLTSSYILFLPLLAICLALIPKTVGMVVRKRNVLAWGGLILVVPIFLTTLHFLLGFIDSRDAIFTVGKACFFAMLLVACVAYCARWPELREQVYLLSFIVLIVSSIGELAVPQYLLEVKRAMVEESFGALSESYGRGTGLFLNPNNLGLACIFCLIGLMAAGARISKWIVVWIVATTLLVLMSGSRTSFLVLVVVVLLYIWMRTRLNGPSSGSIKSVLAVFLIAVTTLLSIGVAVKFIDSSDRWASNRDRFGSLPEVILHANSTDDGSIRPRVDHMSFYMGEVMDNALIGRSTRYTGQLVDQGVVGNASQNTLVDYGISYGVLYPLLIVMAWIGLYRRTRVVGSLDSGTVRIFVLASFLYAFSVDYMLAIEPYVIALGTQLLMRTPFRMKRRFRAPEGMMYEGSERQAGSGCI